MSKKSFKNNPALQFMSNKAEFSENTSQEKESKKQTAEEVFERTSGQKVEQEKISHKDIHKLPDSQKMSSLGFKINSMYIETKSKRFNMLMRPSMFAQLKKGAEEKGVSINEFINIILEAYVFNEDKDIKF
ncbi:MAG: hypothetical protein FWE24_08165 [Defluviitaleaceae bacterium]|nr:hypothetical protein [Defluviitaleaceae bacterium]